MKKKPKDDNKGWGRGKEKKVCVMTNVGSIHDSWTTDGATSLQAPCDNTSKEKKEENRYW